MSLGSGSVFGAVARNNVGHSGRSGAGFHSDGAELISDIGCPSLALKTAFYPAKKNLLQTLYGALFTSKARIETATPILSYLESFVFPGVTSRNGSRKQRQF